MRILDVGCGSLPKLTSTYTEVEVTCCDRYELPGVELQDMENLTYPDNSFDVVLCINALDHTKDAHQAVKEMLRVVKPKGLVYINCALDQMTRHRKKHYWDAKEDGTLISGGVVVNLPAFGFDIEFVDGRMIARRHG